MRAPDGLGFGALAVDGLGGDGEDIAVASADQVGAGRIGRGVDQRPGGLAGGAVGQKDPAVVHVGRGRLRPADQDAAEDGAVAEFLQLIGAAFCAETDESRNDPGVGQIAVGRRVGRGGIGQVVSALAVFLQRERDRRAQAELPIRDAKIFQGETIFGRCDADAVAGLQGPGAQLGRVADDQAVAGLLALDPAEVFGPGLVIGKGQFDIAPQRAAIGGDEGVVGIGLEVGGDGGAAGHIAAAQRIEKLAAGLAGLDDVDGSGQVVVGQVHHAGVPGAGLDAPAAAVTGPAGHRFAEVLEDLLAGLGGVDGAVGGVAGLGQCDFADQRQLDRHVAGVGGGDDRSGVDLGGVDAEADVGLQPIVDDQRGVGAVGGGAAGAAAVEHQGAADVGGDAGRAALELLMLEVECHNGVAAAAQTVGAGPLAGHRRHQGGIGGLVGRAQVVEDAHAAGQCAAQGISEFGQP